MQHTDDEYEDWRGPGGIFVLAPIAGPAAAVLHDLQARFDPRLAAMYPPHVTLAGSSGVGPLPLGTPVEEIRRRLTPLVETTSSLQLYAGPPQRFMQSDIISLPLDPHGPLRVLHDRIARSGLTFGTARFTFTPHVTLNLYRTLTPESERALLAIRIREPLGIERLVLSATDESGPPRTVLEMALSAESAHRG